MAQKPEPGLLVGGRYRLESVLGEGGMAVVWRATHTETDRAVALKLVRGELATEPEVRDMFVREARIAARIGRSDHIVDVLDAGVDDALVAPFLAMELLTGEPLDARIKRDGPVPRSLALELLEQAADALDQAHAAGVFHRDLKPQNLFLAKDRRGKERIKIVDFGIAKLAETVQQSSTHVGTPAYAAPEQLGPSWRAIAEQRGKAISAQVSAATDVWALCLVAYEMLTGSPSGALWGATTLAELPVKMVLEPPPVASARAGARAHLLPTGFDAWLQRGLDLDARARWPSAGGAIAALAPLVSGAPAQAPSVVAVAIPAAPAPASTLPSPGAWAQTPPPYASQPPPPLHVTHPAASQAAASQAAASQAALSQATLSQATQSQATQSQAVPSQAPWSGAAPAHEDPRLVAWAAARGMSLGPGDLRTFIAWQPFVFLPKVERVLREARGVVAGAQVVLGEIATDDTLRRATGEDRAVWALVATPRARFRAALRSTKVVGWADGMAAGLKLLDDLAGTSRPSMLGDPAFEQRFEVKAPSPQEAAYAIPIPLRQLLMAMAFVGTIELRPGGFVMSLSGGDRLEPAHADRLCDLVARVVAAL